MLLNETQTNTIDLDTARAQRNESPARKAATVRSLAELHRLLGQQLQTSLELDRLLSLYFELVVGLIPLDGLGYQHEPTEAAIDLGRNALHRVSYQLSHQAQPLGMLTLRRDRRFDELELNELESTMSCLLYPLTNALLYRRALLAATRDPLTEVGNRTAMTQMLQREVELARRHGLALSVMMLDIDHFKTINDRYGHHQGDEALRQVARLLKGKLRNADMIFRFGGEEFVLLLANTNSEAAAVVGERLRAAVEAFRFEVEDAWVPLSVSLGGATYQAPETPEQLLQRADEALYCAKRSGRNRLSLAAN